MKYTEANLRISFYLIGELGMDDVPDDPVGWLIQSHRALRLAQEYPLEESDDGG